MEHHLQSFQDYFFILIWTPQLLTLTKHLPQLSTKDEEDACPICLEDYDAENPYVMTKCEQHFHCVAFLNGWRDETPVPSVTRSSICSWYNHAVFILQIMMINTMTVPEKQMWLEAI
ncbi:unnamed protein product [Musa hybrid cultivar]